MKAIWPRNPFDFTRHFLLRCSLCLCVRPANTHTPTLCVVHPFLFALFWSFLQRDCCQLRLQNVHCIHYVQLFCQSHKTMAVHTQSHTQRPQPQPPQQNVPANGKLKWSDKEAEAAAAEAAKEWEKTDVNSQHNIKSFVLLSLSCLNESRRIFLMTVAICTAIL